MARMKTIKEQVYEVLKKEILDGTYLPGERVQELQIAKKLNVSRSPVREAIKELIGEGLLVSTPNRSITVRKLSIKEINEIYDFRTLTEQYAIAKTIENLDKTIEKKLTALRDNLKENYAGMDLRQYCKVDSDFHRFLIESSGNSLLCHVVANMTALMEPFRSVSLSSPKRFEESLDEHIAIIDFILARDKDAACEVCNRHLSLAKNKIIDYLTSHPSDEDA